MATARAIFQAHVDSLFPESLPIDLQWTFSNTAGQIQPNVTLNAGDNTLTLPALTKLVLLIPPTTNAATLKLKGAGGDTGFTLQPNLANAFTYFGGNVLVNASAQVTGVTLVFLEAAMSYLTTGLDLRLDPLFLAGEPIDGTSQYETNVYEWLTVVERAIVSGGMFGPSFLEPANWYWARAWPRG